MLKETFLHTRMLQWHWVGIMHWFVYAGFLLLSTAVLAAFFQLFKPDFALPDHRPLVSLRVADGGHRRC